MRKIASIAGWGESGPLHRLIPIRIFRKLAEWEKRFELLRGTSLWK